MGAAYYNENDPFAASWLRQLMKAGLIAPGEVDTRSIEDVVPSDLAGFEQCHFFAGIGVWSYALRCAGWPDERPVWTGSCPCQPFSAAGKGGGFADERHLWPVFHHLIRQYRPAIVFGEQVASKDGLAWLDLIQVDLEGAGYACGAVDTCAAGYGAPHIRQRLYWVADAKCERAGREIGDSSCKNGSPQTRRPEVEEFAEIGNSCVSGGLADAGNEGWERRLPGREDTERNVLNGCAGCNGAVDRPSQTNGFWRDADWLWCRDEKWRPVEPGTFPLAHGAANRVGRLRGYGNALVAPQAEAFIRVAMDILGV